MATKFREDAVFTVALDGISLSDEQIKRIDARIKESVLAEIAKIDHKGDLVINKRLDEDGRFKLFPWGIWIEDMVRFKQRTGFLTSKTTSN